MASRNRSSEEAKDREEDLALAPTVGRDEKTSEKEGRGLRGAVREQQSEAKHGMLTTSFHRSFNI